MEENDLVWRATKGLLSNQERLDLEWKVRSRSPGLYRNLLALGRTGDKKYKQFAIDLLYETEDDSIARLCIQILCRYFGLYKESRDILLEFIEGVDWDEAEFARHMAISCAGTYLREYQDLDLLSALYRIFQDETEDQHTREIAYSGLGEACGLSGDELPPASRHFDLAKDVDQDVLRMIELRIMKI